MIKTVILTALMVGLIAAGVICLIVWIATDINHITERDEEEDLHP